MLDTGSGASFPAAAQVRPALGGDLDRVISAARLKGRLRRADVISFDVFDTAILRPLTDPRDLFDLMQPEVSRLVGGDGLAFPAARTEAELAARMRAWEQKREEVTLAEIYRALGEVKGLDAATQRKLLQLEIEAEQAVCRANPFIHAVYCWCRDNGRRVAFVSDSYLPEDVIAGILAQAGYHTYDALLVSSSHGKTKMSRRLFAEAKTRVAFHSGRWLHIGDDLYSDIRMGRKAGIATWHYERCMNRFNRSPDAAAWTGHEPDHSARPVVQGLVANRLTSARILRRRPRETDTFWHDFGYVAAGPLLVGFTEWLIEQARAHELEALYFLAREGLVMQRVYQAVAQQSGLETHYLLASRRAMGLAAIDKVEKESLAFLTGGGPGLGVAHYLERIGLDWQQHGDAIRAVGFDSPNHKMANGRDYANLEKLFVALEQPICARAREERAVLLEYLRRCGLCGGRRVGMVDVGWRGSIQQAVVRLLGPTGDAPQIRGLYLGTVSHPTVVQPNLCHEAYLFRLGHPRHYCELIMVSVALVEFMCSAAEGSIIRIERDAEGEFVPLRQDDGRDDYRNDSLRKLQEGAMQFVDDYVALKRRFPEMRVSRETAVAQLRRVLRHPTALEARRLGDIPHAVSFAEFGKVPIAPAPRLASLLHGRSGIRRHNWNVCWSNGSDVRASPLYRAISRLLMRSHWG